jgi:hypothetical protein
VTLASSPLEATRGGAAPCCQVLRPTSRRLQLLSPPPGGGQRWIRTTGDPCVPLSPSPLPPPSPSPHHHHHEVDLLGCRQSRAPSSPHPAFPGTGAASPLADLLCGGSSGEVLSPSTLGGGGAVSSLTLASPLRAATSALPDIDPASLLLNSARVAAWGWTVSLSSPRTGKPEAPIQSLNHNSGWAPSGKGPITPKD